MGIQDIAHVTETLHHDSGSVEIHVVCHNTCDQAWAKAKGESYPGATVQLVSVRRLPNSEQEYVFLITEC